MAARDNIVKINIPMCIACVLLCLTLFSFHFTGGLYAKYIARGSSKDSARVAEFKVTEDCSHFSENLVIDFTPGEVKKEILVSNESEVAISYTITVENTTENIPLKFYVEDGSGTEYECPKACALDTNSSETYTLYAKWDPDDALDYMGMVDLIKIYIDAVQID